MDIMTVHKENQPIYDIWFRDSFNDLAEAMKDFNIANRRVCIVSETNVASHYLQEVEGIISANSKECTSFVFPEGEENKCLATVQKLYEHLIINQFDRSDLLIALGGGVVGDLTGYTAATYLRGIDFIQVPTSLLAQVDSSIGGKTGVDFDSYKNMVGAFHQPKLVYINLATLQTLSDRQFNSGLGEVIKHGLIKREDYFAWILDHAALIKQRDLATLEYLVMNSCDVKRLVVELDPTEKGDRALLNFGHTLGHAIEKLMDFQLYHGECVGIGCVLAAIISKNKQLLTDADVDQVKELFDLFQFPTFPTQLDLQTVVDVTKNDKKMKAGVIRFVLLDRIGNAYIDTTVSDQDMLDAMSEAMNG